MKTDNLIINLTLQEFKESIKSVKDFPTLEEFIKWADKHRVHMVSAFNYLAYIIKHKNNLN